jgi:hypothetical protein
MPVEISFGGVCRDIEKLPVQEPELRKFFETTLVPAMWQDFSQNVSMVKKDGERSIQIPKESLRGCEIGGSVNIRF